MKNICLLSILALTGITLTNISFAQNTFPATGAAGIGTTSPNASSLLDVTSTTKGVLVPRMTKTQRDAIISPATGLLIYQTNNTPGFYYYSGAAWTAISSKGANTSLSNLVSPTAVNQHLFPDTTGTLDLGSSTLRWRDVYPTTVKFPDGTTQTTAFTPYTNGTGISISGTTITNTSPDQTITLTPGSGISITGSYPDFTIASTATGGANKSLSNLTAPTAVNVNLLPKTDNTLNLGNSSLGWKDIYLTGKLYLDGNVYLDNSGIANTFIGNTGNTTNTGISNTAVGKNSFHSNTTGNYNTANGIAALYSNTTGFDNTATGLNALYSNTTGADNTAYGVAALYLNSTGNDNTANGIEALHSNTTGNANTADGEFSGKNVTTGSYNTFIGYSADCGTFGTLTNSTVIGYAASVTSSNNFVFGNGDVLGWGFGVEAGSRAIKVGSNIFNGDGAYLTGGGVWTDISDRSKKENITGLDKNAVLEKILQLKVTQWKYKGTKNEYHIGPMADDFHRLFEVGDDSSISSMDKTGVLFLGMQALSEEDLGLKTEDVRQKSKVDSLQFMVYSLQKEVGDLKSEIENPKSEMTSGFAKLQTSNSKLQTPLLGQNIPNPFDNSTLIPFRIPKDCNDASIMITNTSTSQVISVIPISCNEDHVSVDAGMLASGMYSYTLYVNGKMIDTKSMVLNR